MLQLSHLALSSRRAADAGALLSGTNRLGPIRGAHRAYSMLVPVHQECAGRDCWVEAQVATGAAAV